MYSGEVVFAQLMEFLPRHKFNRCVRRYRGNDRVRRFAKNGDDGLIHFTIIRHLSEPSYLVAHFEVRDKDSVVVKGDFPAFVEEKVARYWFAVSPKHLPGARFVLGESDFSTMNGARIPTVGGSTDYKICLADFAPKASETSSE